MTERELQKLVETISIRFFSRPFLHKATFNARLKTTGGRYLLDSHHLDFNPRVYQLYGMEELIGVIKHELCHYHLHIQGRGYRHQDLDFKQLLVKTNGSRYVKDLRTEEELVSMHCYSCKDCQQDFRRKRKINTQKYRCGRCRGKLMKIN